MEELSRIRLFNISDKVSPMEVYCNSVTINPNNTATIHGGNLDGVTLPGICGAEVIRY